MGSPPGLPARFPCWCQATYSWGGETKKDLGFIEGDLIEALNAGDGSWWMGRLRRDPRAIGLFPSNFVKVLDQGFQPAPNHRKASPMQQPISRPTNNKGGTFRKPFTAYEKLGPRGSLDNSREDTPDSDKEKKKKEKSKFRPYASMKTAQPPAGTLKKQNTVAYDDRPRIPDPVPRRRASRPPTRQADAAFSRYSASPTPEPQNAYASTPPSALRRTDPRVFEQPSCHASPLPSTYHDGSAYPQILPSAHQGPAIPYLDHQSRPVSPGPVYQYNDPDEYPPEHYAPEAYDHHDVGSSPPPPPPPAHRIAYQSSRAPSPQPGHHGSQTPIPPSPGGRMTPSPLRDAMNDVMTSLQGMTTYHPSVHQRSPSPMPDPREMGEVWSPDAYELVRSRSIAEQRAHSSHGFRSQDARADHYEHATSQAPSQSHQHERPAANDDYHDSPTRPQSRGGMHQLDDYVQRMEDRFGPSTSQPSYMAEEPPQPPLKGAQFSRPATSSSQASRRDTDEPLLPTLPDMPTLRARKSAYELGAGRHQLNRMHSTRTNVTNSTATSSATQSSNSTQLTSHSLMSGYSAGGFSATSAGSLARRKFGQGSIRGHHRSHTVADTRSMVDLTRQGSATTDNDDSMSGPSYHESHATFNQHPPTPTADWSRDPMESAGVLGGMMAPKARKSGFFRKMIDSAKSTARTGAASARSTLGSTSRPGSRSGGASPTKSAFGSERPSSVAGGHMSRPSSSHSIAAKDMGGRVGAGGNDWMHVRRDVNRSNTLSRREREERLERRELLDQPGSMPIELLNEIAEGDEGLDGLPVAEPTDFNSSNLVLVDKSARFIQSLPPMVTPAALAQSYVCRPHRSDVQRLRAIFTWVSERITWEDDYEGTVDSRRVIQAKRGCSEEIAVLVHDMCSAVGLHAEVVRGYLKAPGEFLDLDTVAHPNHWWNAVIVDGEWRIMDCALAGPTHPRRGAYSSASSQAAESWYFLARPLEICYTHIPLLPEQQHIVPPVEHEILIALPCAGPAYFRNGLELSAFDTGLLHLENLEMAHVHVTVPEDVECVAETEARGFAQDVDGDTFESGDTVQKPALAQVEWIGGRKRFTIKALLPGDEGHGVLKIYAGKRGLMHSIRDNPHPLACALPLSHTGQNPPYDFHIRHPTPHAQRHDLYVAQPQCSKLVLNNTFVFCVRQHPSSLSRFTPDTWGGSSRGGPSGGGGMGTRPGSPNPYVRPSSAMSMTSATLSVAASSNYSDPSSTGGGINGAGMTPAQQKPAKLAIQTPSQKIIRLTRKQEHSSSSSSSSTANGQQLDTGLTTSWETVVKIGERGTWRGLVLADRSARWCVFAEWECV